MENSHRMRVAQILNSFLSLQYFSPQDLRQFCLELGEPKYDNFNSEDAHSVRVEKIVQYHILRGTEKKLFLAILNARTNIAEACPIDVSFLILHLFKRDEASAIERTPSGPSGDIPLDAKETSYTIDGLEQNPTDKMYLEEAIERFLAECKTDKSLWKWPKDREKIKGFLLDKSLLTANGKMTLAGSILFTNKGNTNVSIFGPKELSTPHDLKTEQMPLVIVYSKIRQYFEDNGIISYELGSSYSTQAIGEALINFLVHRDYSVASEAQIKITKEAVIFINPGCSLVEKRELENIWDNEHDLALEKFARRNETLYKAFVTMNLAHMQGGGIKRIKESQRELLSLESGEIYGYLGIPFKDKHDQNLFEFRVYKKLGNLVELEEKNRQLMEAKEEIDRLAKEVEKYKTRLEELIQTELRRETQDFSSLLRVQTRLDNLGQNIHFLGNKLKGNVADPEYKAPFFTSLYVDLQKTLKDFEEVKGIFERQVHEVITSITVEKRDHDQKIKGWESRVLIMLITFLSVIMLMSTYFFIPFPKLEANLTVAEGEEFVCLSDQTWSITLQMSSRGGKPPISYYWNAEQINQTNRLFHSFSQRFESQTGELLTGAFIVISGDGQRVIQNVVLPSPSCES